MKVSLMEFGFQISNDFILPSHPSYRPPHWPPPNDWVVSEDSEGHPLSQWGGPVWDFSEWVGKVFVLNFAEAKYKRNSKSLGLENQHLLRLLTTWLIWGPRGQKKWRTLKNNFLLVRRLTLLCEENGILLSELERFPKVVDQVAEVFASSSDRKYLLLLLDRFLRGKEVLGFSVMGELGLASLAKSFNACAKEDDETEQTAYIPPRIWSYQSLRLRECLEDFMAHADKVEACYHFCVDAYAKNFGSLNKAMAQDRSKAKTPPFSNRQGRPSKTYLGTFFDIAKRFNVVDLLDRWLDTSDITAVDIRQFGSYLTMVQMVAITYIAGFTLQRKDEAASLRSDCLQWENDSIVGRVAIIVGETTKTDPDSDARWPTSPSVEIAVQAASCVAKMRIRCAMAMPEMLCTAEDANNPFLLHYATDPWYGSKGRVKPYFTRPEMLDYRTILNRFPKVLDLDTLRMSEEDLRMARMFTPNLDKKGKFTVGNPWPFAHHQLRRTGGINMFASGLLSDSSVQVVMKHMTLLQSTYYGRNFSRLRFNEDIEGLTNASKYEVMAKQIETLVSERYVSPLGEERKHEIVVKLVAEKDFKSLIKAAQRGEVSFRETRLGGCAKRGHCDYGGVESVARCAGGDGDKPCRDAIFDKAKRPVLERALERVEKRLQTVEPNSLRQKALKSEEKGIRNYLDVTRD